MLQNNAVKIRCTIGLLQGIALYLLYMAITYKVWPATQITIFEPLLMICLFIPLLITMGITKIKVKTLITWVILASFLLVCFGFYDAWRTYSPLFPGSDFFPTSLLFCFSIIGLFIAQALVTSGDIDGSVMAQYSTYFDISWKMLIQLIMSSLFLGTFWLVLWTGASLFHMINLEFLTKLIQKSWFVIPATSLIFTIGLHVTDVRVNLVKGVRTLILTLLSWLLPLFTFIVSAFLISLLFTGMGALWKLEYTAFTLFFTAGFLIILINAAYQDGKPMPRILAYACSIATLILLPLIALAIYAISLETAKNGWTIQYVLLGYGLFIAAFYALGYAFFSFRLQGLEKWNFYAAIITLCVLIFSLTPAVDPIRLSVASQLARLQSGQISAEKFDFEFLRWYGGRFGHQALTALKISKNPLISKRASAVLAAKDQYEKPNPESLIMAHTANNQLPSSFMHQDWNAVAHYNFPNCLVHGVRPCDAWTMNFLGKNGIIILDINTVSVFQETSPKEWKYLGNYNLPYNCKKILEQAKTGSFNWLPPQVSFPDLELMGQRFPFTAADNNSCGEQK